MANNEHFVALDLLYKVSQTSWTFPTFSGGYNILSSNSCVRLPSLLCKALCFDDFTCCK